LGNCYDTTKLFLLGSPRPILGMKVKRHMKVNYVIFKDKLFKSLTDKNVESSQLIWLIIGLALKINNQIVVFPCFTFIPKKRMRRPKTGVLVQATCIYKNKLLNKQEVENANLETVVRAASSFVFFAHPIRKNAARFRDTVRLNRVFLFR